MIQKMYTYAVQSKYEIYLKRNKALHELTYPMYYQWWRKSTYSEQQKAEKNESKGNSPITVGYKGKYEFLELKQSIQDRVNVVTLFKERLDSLTHNLMKQSQLQRAALSTIKMYLKILT